MSGQSFSPELFASALAAVEGLGPKRLRVLLQRSEPEDAWQQVLSGRAFPNLDGPTADELRRSADRIDLVCLHERMAQAGVTAEVLGSPGYPEELSSDVEAPAVVFLRGSRAALRPRRVAIVGTRRATASGRSIAAELGADLARHGVAVVSGLALGIDGATHRGALTAEGAMPIGVVGSGLDVPYPERHRDLWNEVAGRGLLISEAPPGTPARAFRFPLRNRIIAALAEVVVVVESHASGGSLLTVNHALARDRTVMAVPGSPRNPASMGTNALLRDGAQAVQDVGDILIALGIGRLQFSVPSDPRRAPGPFDARVLDAVGDLPVHADEIASITGESFVEVALSLARLEVDGWLVRSGAYFERLRQSTAALAARP